MKTAAFKLMSGFVILSLILSLVPRPLVAQAVPKGSISSESSLVKAPDPLAHVGDVSGDDPKPQPPDATLYEPPTTDWVGVPGPLSTFLPVPMHNALDSATLKLPKLERSEPVDTTVFLPLVMLLRGVQGNQVTIPPEGGTLHSMDDLVDIEVHPGAVTAPVRLTYRRHHWHHPVPWNYADTHIHFSLRASHLTDGADVDRLRVPSADREKPGPESEQGNLMVIVHYPAGVVAQNLESRLALARFDERLGTWVFVESRVDRADHRVTAFTDRLGEFALLALPDAPSEPPASAIVTHPVRDASLNSVLATSIVVDDEDGGVGTFTRDGVPSYWWHREHSTYYDGDMWFTFDSDQNPNRLNWATWQTPPLTDTGVYTVVAQIPLFNAETRGANYLITHSGSTTPYMVDQLANRGRAIELGTFSYNAGDQGEVYLDDVVPETGWGEVRIGYDAMIWLPPGVTWALTSTLVPYDPLWAQLGLQPWSGAGGEPVSTGLGNFYTQHQDLYVPGRGLDVDFKRAYNSLNPRLGSFGLGSSYAYDMKAVDRGNGEIIVTLADGRAGLYVPDGSGFIRPDGFLAELSRSGGHLILTDVDQTVYAFNTDATLASITDSNGNQLTFAYDPDGYTLTDTVGRTFRVEFNVDGYIEEITDPIGRIYTYEYDGDKLIAFHDAEGGTISYTYNAENWMESITDPNNYTFVTNHYNEQGRVDWQQDASGSTTTFAYQESPRITTITDNLGHQTIHEFDDQYRLVKETDALGHSMVYEYDDDNNRTYIQDRGGHETFMQYDDRGNVLTHRDALSQTAEFQYDARNNLTFAQDEAGAETFYTYDARNNLTHIHDAEDGDTWMTYNNRGLLETLRDANGNLTQFTYDAQGNLETVEDALHDVIRFEYDGVGRQTKMTDANAHTVDFTYDGNDRVTAITDPKGQTTLFTYDPVGNLTAVTDRRGYTTAYAYNENDSLVTVTDTRGYTATFTYDLMYHRETFTDRRGHTTRYAYDAVYNLTQVTDAKGTPTHLAYDADRNLITLTDALSETTTFAYDPLHRVITATDALSGVTGYAYDPVGRPVQVQAPNGAVTSYAYDRLGRLRTLTDTLSNVTRLGYDAVGNLTVITNARGFATHYDYDAVNQLVKVTDPLSHTLQLGYDGVGNVISMTNSRGHSTLFVYDPNDNLEQVTDALGGLLTYTYDEEDNRLSVTNPNGHTTAFAYDPLGNLISVTLPLGQLTNFTYDPNSNLVAVTNAKGKTTYFTYDELDLLTTRTDPLAYVTAYEHDALRRLTRIIDAEENATDYRYDPLDRLIAVTDALSGTTTYEYDPVGNLIAYTDANGHRTAFDVDLLGRVLTETNPISHTWSYAYDPVGNLTRRTDAEGVVTQYTFDAADRLTDVVYPSGPDVALAYDENDNLIGLTDASGAAAYAYDELDRLVEAQRTAGILAGETLGYSYDPASNRTRVTYPDGKVVRYGYNANEWLASVIDPMTGMTSYSYDPVGLPTHVQYPNGTWTDYSYDDADRLVHLFNGKPEASTELVSSFDYTLDGVGNRVRTVQKSTRGQVITWDKRYTYDPLYRLLEAVETPDFHPAQVLTSTFSYDAVGNRLLMSTNIHDQPNTPPHPELLTTTYTYNAANQMLTAGTTDFSYDADGNRVSMVGDERVISYTYDFENRLVGAETFDVLPNDKWKYDSTLDFTYDGLGRRVQRGVVDKGKRKTADFLYDALGYDLLAQYVDPGSPRTTYYYRDPLQILSRHEIQGAGKGLQYFYHYDGLGNVSAWTNHAGRAVQEYNYAPYGRLIDNNGPDNSSNRTDPHNSLAWSGKPWDKETELYYFGARDYDPTMGVWLTQDSYRGRLHYPVSLHRSAFVGGNPISRIEHYGYWFGVDDLIYAGVGGTIGATFNVGTQYVSDVSNSIAVGRGWKSILPTTSWQEYATKGAAGFMGGAVQGWICGNTAGVRCVVGGGGAGGVVSQVTENFLEGEDLRKDVIESAGANIVGTAVGEIYGPKVVGRKAKYFWSALTKRHGQSEWIKGILGGFTTEMFKQVFTQGRSGQREALGPSQAIFRSGESFAASRTANIIFSGIRSAPMAKSINGGTRARDWHSMFDLGESKEAGVSASLRPQNVVKPSRVQISFTEHESWIEFHVPAGHREGSLHLHTSLPEAFVMAWSSKPTPVGMQGSNHVIQMGISHRLARIVTLNGFIERLNDPNSWWLTYEK